MSSIFRSAKTSRYGAAGNPGEVTYLLVQSIRSTLRRNQHQDEKNAADNLEIRTAVHNPRARLVILLLGDPQVLESGQRSEDGTTDPDGVFSLGRGHNFDLQTTAIIYINRCPVSYSATTDLHAGWG